jgi:hypothetical protein
MHYILGKQPVLLGDRLLVNLNRMATISLILEPQSNEAKKYNLQQGGAFIEFDDGDLWFVDANGFHEDFELMSRGTLTK